jgi:dTDP-glucose 4,6-dehydratase
MRLLVTGAAGFIGSNFVRRLLAPAAAGEVERVVAVDLLTYAGNLQNLGDALGDPRVRFERLDIADHPAMTGLVADEAIDAIVNFAAETHVDRSIDDHGPFLRTNVHGVLALLDAVRGRTGFRRFLQVSTDVVYGSVATGRSTETAPLRPSSPYAASKPAADAFVQAYATTHAVPVTITRCCNNYGPYQFPEKLIPLFVTNALEDRPLPVYGDGLQVRDWIHVDDHCDAIWHLLRRDEALGETYNVSAHDERTNREVTALILRATGRTDSLLRTVRDRPGHDRRYALDATRLLATGWVPRHRFEDGLAETVAWYRREQTWVEAVRSGEYRAYYEHMYGHRLRESES